MQYSEKDIKLEQSKFKAYLDKELLDMFYNYKGDRNCIYFKALAREIRERNIDL